MSNIIPLNKNKRFERTVYNDAELDRLDRIRATKGLAKEMFPAIPFYGILFGFGGLMISFASGHPFKVFIVGFLLGASFGLFAMLLMCSEMRYGKRL